MSALTPERLAEIREHFTDTCGYTAIDADGIEQPCGKPATGWRWYGEGHDHEPMLAPACILHNNAAGERMHALEMEVERLRAGIAEAQDVSHLGSDCAACDMREVLHDLLNPPTEGNDHE